MDYCNTRDYDLESDAKEYLRVLISLSQGIFHDCKNILGTISGLSQLSELNAGSDEVKENLRRIYKASFECRDIMDSFYGLIEGYDGKDRQDTSLSSIILNIFDMIKHKLHISKNHREIEIDLNINSLSKVNCNPYRVKQAIMNLILNALDAMEAEGGILGIHLHDKRDALVLEISDTGIGIPEENMDKIFRSSFTTKGKAGTGLGLKISKDTFEEHDGSISVKSQIQRGSKFTIHLPLVEEDIIDIQKTNRYNHN